MSGNANITLVLGGARSGKSKFAEELAASHAGPCVYVATGQPGDAEMAERIDAHRKRRGSAWVTIEEPLDLAGAIGKASSGSSFVLIDCLTLWLSNVMLGKRDTDVETAALIAALEEARGRLVLVSNEVGLGLVPETKLGRDFRDAAGRLNQRVADCADEVVFIAAGLPLKLKPSG